MINSRLINNNFNTQLNLIILEFYLVPACKMCKSVGLLAVQKHHGGHKLALWKIAKETFQLYLTQ